MTAQVCVAWNGCQGKGCSFYKEYGNMYKFCEKLVNFWDSVLGMEIFGHTAQRHVWRRLNTAYQYEHFLPAVKHSGGEVMIWSHFAATGTGHLGVIESSCECQSIPESKYLSHESQAQQLINKLLNHRVYIVFQRNTWVLWELSFFTWL